MSKNENGNILNQTHNNQRLCHIVKRDDFDGYGFNLHSEKGKPGQYIGKVDDNSPAELAGLKQGDRIIEVNSVSIGKETHTQVVQRIKAIENEVRLLVIDPKLETKDQKHITINNSTTNVNNNVTVTTESLQSSNITTTPPPPNEKQMMAMPPHTIDTNENETNTNVDKDRTDYHSEVTNNNKPSSTTSSIKSNSSSNKHQNNNKITNDDEWNQKQQSPKSTGSRHTPIMNHSPLQKDEHNNQMQSQQQSSSSSTVVHQNGSSPQPPSPQQQQQPQSAKLNLPMTAAEMRAKLLSKKKYDPKNDTVDLKKKFEIIQKL